MKELESKVVGAGKFSWFAERDARMRSIVNSSLFTGAQKIKAERVKLALGLCVKAQEFFVEYRKSFISVKVHKPCMINRNQLKELEDSWAEEGITKVITSQGFTYRLFAN